VVGKQELVAKFLFLCLLGTPIIRCDWMHWILVLFLNFWLNICSILIDLECS
jgi:hypothetical protein